MKASANQKIIVRCWHGKEWEPGKDLECSECLNKIENNQVDTTVHSFSQGWISFSKEDKNYQLYQNEGLQ